MLIPASDLLSGLRDYSTSKYGVPQLSQKLREISDLEGFVRGLSEKQLSGKSPIIGAYQPPIVSGGTGCKLDLYWNPKDMGLSIDWTDVPTGNPIGC